MNMSHGTCEFFQNKRKDVCNKQVSFDFFSKKTEFFDDFNLWFSSSPPYFLNHLKKDKLFFRLDQTFLYTVFFIKRCLFQHVWNETNTTVF